MRILVTGNNREVYVGGALKYVEWERKEKFTRRR